MWSKEKIDHKEDDATILEKVERRFAKTFPLDHLNLLFCISLDEAVINDKKSREGKSEEDKKLKEETKKIVAPTPKASKK